MNILRQTILILLLAALSPANATPLVFRECVQALSSTIGELREVLREVWEHPEDVRLRAQIHNIRQIENDEREMTKDRLSKISRHAIVDMYSRRHPEFYVRVCEHELQLYDRNFMLVSFTAGSVVFLSDNLVHRFIEGKNLVKPAEVVFMHQKLGLKITDALIFQARANQPKSAFEIRKYEPPAVWNSLEYFSGI